MSFVEGSLNLNLELAPNAIANLKQQLERLEKQVALNIQVPKTAQANVQRLTQTATSGFNQVKNAANGATQAFEKQSKVVQSLNNHIKGLVSATAGYLSVSTLVKAVNIAADYEAQEKALVNLTGSQEKANQILEQARRISTQSGIGINEITAAYQKLFAQNPNASVSELTGSVELYSRAVIASGGDTQNFGRAVNAVTQIMSKGTLQQEELRGQLAEAIPGLRIEEFFVNLGKVMGVTTERAKELAQDGAVPAAAAIQALNNTLVQSPGVMNAFETRSTTLRGVLDKLKNQGFTALTAATKDFSKSLTSSLSSSGLDAQSFGKVLKPVFDGLIPVFQALVDALVKSLPLVVSLAELFANLAPAAAEFASLLSGPIIGGLTGVLRILNVLNPLVQILLTRFLALRTAALVVTGLTTAANAMPIAFTGAGVAALGLGARIASLAGPIGIAIGAFFVLSNVMDRVLGDKTKQVFEQVSDAISGINAAASDTQVVDAFFDNIVTQSKSAADIKKRLAELFAQDPGAAKRLVEAAERQHLLIEENGQVVNLREVYDKLVGSQKASTDALLENLGLNKAAAATQSAVTSALEDTIKKLDTLARGFDAVKSAGDRVKSVQATIKNLQQQLAEIPERLKDAEFGVADARQRVTDATKNLNDLEAKRAALLADTGASAREVADAEADSLRIRQQLVDIDQEEADVRRELADLERDTPDDRAAADRAIQKAQIALNQAKREELELKKELNKEDEVSLNLTGLSVDQIKSVLAGARAQAAAQRSVKKAKKSQAEIDEQTLSSQLSVLDAEQALKDAVQSRADLEIDLGIKKRELDEKLVSLGLDRESTLRRQQEQQVTLNTLRSGETTAALAIKGLDDQIAQAKRDQVTAVRGVETALRDVRGVEEDRRTINDQIREAKEKQRDAEKEVRDAIAQRKADVATILGDEREINRLVLERVKALPAGTQAEQEVQRRLLSTLVPSLLSSAITTGGSGRSGKPIAATITPQLLDDIVGRLLRSSGSDVLEELRKILRSVGLSIPGLAQGGVIEGVQGKFGTLIRAGEFGRREAVLPLQNQAALQRLLQMPTVLNPVLNALPRISLPTQQGPTLPALAATPNLPVVSRTPNGASASSAQQLQSEQRKQNSALATAIADALVERGFTGGIAEGAIQVTVTPADTLDSAVLVRKIKRAVADELHRR